MRFVMSKMVTYDYIDRTRDSDHGVVSSSKNTLVRLCPEIGMVVLHRVGITVVPGDEDRVVGCTRRPAVIPLPDVNVVVIALDNYLLIVVIVMAMVVVVVVVVVVMVAVVIVVV